MTEKITSRANDKIKAAAALVASAKCRRQSGEFLAEGLRLCADAARTKVKIKQLFFTAQAYEQHTKQLDEIIAEADESFEISPEVEQKLSDTQSSQGVFCVCAIPENSLNAQSISGGGKYIVLENIQNPANLGAICRTAEALGIDGAVLSGCCDAFSPKAQRAAMGSLFRLPMMITDDLPGLLKMLLAEKMRVLATTPDSSAQKITHLSFDSGALAVIGNEANGVSREILEMCTPVTIPMGGRAESLNASMAAALVMWEMVR